MSACEKKVFFEKYMNFVGPLGNSMFYFQAYKIFTSENSGSVSLWGFVISVFALTSWLLYGFFIKNTPLIVANAVGAIGAVLVVIGVALYPS